MKKKSLILVSFALIFSLTACGSSRSSFKSADNGAGFEMASNSYEDSYYITGGDYSNTYIEGDRVDYSYQFRAGGSTNKSKAEMLDDYEHIQDFVVEREGFLESVYNDYNYFDLKEDYNAKDYVYRGQLSFTIQIDNKYIDEVMAELEKLCQDNRFTVTTYSQTIHNYKTARVVPDEEYYSSEYTYQGGNTMSQSELDSRLKYADISVNLSYYKERSKLVKFGLTIKEVFEDIWDIAGELLTTIIIILITLLVLFVEFKVFYKSFKKMQFKFRTKHPEYYPPQGVNIVSPQGTTCDTPVEKKDN